MDHHPGVSNSASDLALTLPLEKVGTRSRGGWVKASQAKRPIRVFKGLAYTSSPSRVLRNHVVLLEGPVAPEMMNVEWDRHAPV